MDDKTEQALNMARCANSNMDNLERYISGGASDPMFIIVRAQIRSAIDLLEGGDGELKLDA